MFSEHNAIIAAAGRAALTPLGFQRRGRSRLWLLDHGTWLNVVEFTPSAWSRSVTLTSAAHWLWAGTGFLSYDHADPSRPHAEFEDADQFRAAMTTISNQAADQARTTEARFATFDLIRRSVTTHALESDRLRPSWAGYHAGIAAGLTGASEEAATFLGGLTDERVAPHAAALLPLIDDPERFRSAINQRVATQRAALKLPALTLPPF